MQNQFRKFWPAACLLAVLPLAVLMNRSNEHVDVSGLVFFNNQPVPHATIFFQSETNSEARSLPAVTNEVGWYSVPKGLEPGRYRVIVRGFSERPENAGGLDPGQQMARFDATQQFTSRPTEARKGFRELPEQFSSATATTLRLDVPAAAKHSADLFLDSNPQVQIASEQLPSVK